LIIKGFGDRLRWLRGDETQKKLSKKIGTSQKYISQLEKEQRGPSVIILLRLSDYYKVTMDYLTLRTDNVFLEEDESREA